MAKSAFEFVVEGPPYSANKSDKKPKTDWQLKVRVAAYKQWLADRRPTATLPHSASIEAYITTYCRDTLYDVDNVLKWTLDGLKVPEADLIRGMNSSQRRLHDSHTPIYVDDNQIDKITSVRVDLNKAELDPPPLLVEQALEDYREFLYIQLFWEEDEA